MAEPVLSCSANGFFMPSNQARLLRLPEGLATNRAGEQHNISVRKRFHSISVTRRKKSSLIGEKPESVYLFQNHSPMGIKEEEA